MVRYVELLEQVQKFHPDADEAALERAYVFAMKAHGNQKRASGAPYITHPLEVAKILADMRLDESTVIAALLHDTIEDTHATHEEIAKNFGPKIAELVDGLTKIAELDLVTKKAEQAENFRKLLVSISTDIRVLMVKLADRLHNMRTLEHMREDKQRRISEETLEIYAPLAGRMGMHAVREELEELAFRYGQPEGWESITARVTQLHQRNAGLTSEIREELGKRLMETGIRAEVHGRKKRPYSIWRKMERKNIAVEQLSDIYAFRIIVDTEADCYRSLGVVHMTWPIVPGRFKDYISVPKRNDYRSIHTTVIGPRSQRVELQIRTHAMHEIAEYGIAAHAMYKGNEAAVGDPLAAGSETAQPARIGTNGHSAARPAATDSQAYRWLRQMVDELLAGENAEEFLENTKLELFHDQVFCFTPKGELIALPHGATPIDFAYAVHTDVGNTCVGCRVNGRSLPLATQLRNGDEVEIITSKGQSPIPSWDGIAVTGKARSAIRRATREALRGQYIKLGEKLLEKAFMSAGETFDAGKLKNNLHRLARKNIDDVYAAVGRNELPTDDVLRAVHPTASPRKPGARIQLPRNRYDGGSSSGTDDGWLNLGKVFGLRLRLPGSARPVNGGDTEGEPAAAAGQGGLPIRGQRSDLPVAFAEGGAVPGDRIVGILTPGQGIKIYPIHSPELRNYEKEPDRWIDVTWDIDHDNPERFSATLDVTARNEPGTLARVARVIGEADGNIDTLTMQSRASDFTVMRITVEVWDLAHLGRILTGLKAENVVSKVERLFS